MSRNKACNHHRVGADNTLLERDQSKEEEATRQEMKGKNKLWRAQHSALHMALQIRSHATACGVQHESVLLYCSAAWHAADSCAFHSMQRLVLVRFAFLCSTAVSPKAAKAAVAESVWRNLSLHSCWKMAAGSARVQFATRRGQSFAGQGSL